MIGLRALPIHRRVALVVVLTSAAGVLASMAALATVEYARGRARLRAELEVLADVVSANTTAALAYGDREAAEETIGSLAVAPGVRCAALYDAQGRLFAVHAPAPTAVPRVRPPPGVRFTADALVLVQDVMLGRRRLGTLYVEQSLAGLWAQLLRQVGIAAGALLLASLLAWALSTRLQVSITGPLKRLEEVARRVAAEGAPAARVAVEGRDEVSDALLAFNAMLDELEAKEVALVAAKAEAEEGTRLKSAFLANMSHEIRTPLTAIIGFAEMLVEEVEGEPREFAELISRAGSRLLDTLSAVLELSRFEAGGVRLSTVPVDVVSEVDEALRLLQPLALEKRLRLHADGNSPEAYALLDRVGLGQIIDNLVRNAIKFTEHGEILVTVTTDGERVRLEVRDTGSGIEERFLPHLFDEFSQESIGFARRHEGVGLGLSITRRLVHMMDGEIEVWSRKGVGSVFTVTFPRLAAEPTVEVAEVEPAGVDEA